VCAIGEEVAEVDVEVEPVDERVRSGDVNVYACDDGLAGSAFTSGG
jgi:hypothetical protein